MMTFSVLLALLLFVALAAASLSGRAPAGLRGFRIGEADHKTSLLRASPRLLSDGSVTIYVLDSGVRTSHRSFDRHFTTAGVSIIPKEEGIVSDGSVDLLGHGTHVASVAAKAAPNNTVFVPISVIDSNGLGSSLWLQNAIDWVTKTHRHSLSRGIVLMSLSSVVVEEEEQYTLDPFNVRKAISKVFDYWHSLIHADGTATLVQNALDEGLIIITAAGNANIDACKVIPASIPGVITIAASTMDKKRAKFSNFGPCVSLFAPGVQVAGASYESDNGEWQMSGTSTSAPLVAGRLADFAKNMVHETSAYIIEQFIQAQTEANGISDLECDDEDRLICQATTRRLLV